MTDSPVLEVRDLTVRYRRPGLGARAAPRPALQGVSLDVQAGESVALVGESGSGKSTLARAVLRLVPPTSGQVRLLGEDWLGLPPRELRRRRQWVQMVFQDPFGSLNPRLTAGEALAEPLRALRPELDPATRANRVSAALERVGLTAADAQRYPRSFSGGQCQRVGIARAMICEPRLLICDEPVSSLDVSIQGQIVNLLLDLQRQAGTALLFISHHLALVRLIATRVHVLYQGRIVESGTTREVLDSPRHPYTQSLIAAVPQLADSGGANPLSSPS